MYRQLIFLFSAVDMPDKKKKMEKKGRERQKVFLCYLRLKKKLFGRGKKRQNRLKSFWYSSMPLGMCTLHELFCFEAFKANEKERKKKPFQLM